ncbi:MAG: S9 family peptidase, partial [Steroidobacteraceae bacterium]
MLPSNDQVVLTLGYFRGEVSMGYRRKIVSAAMMLVLCAATLLTPVRALAGTATAAATRARIATIMRRLRDVQRFGAVALAPNGRTVAWTVSERGGQVTTQILQLAALDGSDVRTVRIPDGDRACHYGSLQWSPDSHTLAFLSDCNEPAKRANQLDIYEVRAHGHTARRISHLDGFVHELAWTPDGRALSFLYVQGDLHPIAAVSPTKPQIGVIGRDGVEHQRLAMLPADGGAVRQITPASLFVYEYDWAPAGERVAYVAAPPPGRDNWWTAKLYTQQVGSAPEVTLDPATVSGSLHGLQIALPRWSPDGSKIALIGGLMSDQGATGGDVYLVDASGGAPVDVTPGIDISPSWLQWTGHESLLVSSFAGGSTRLSSFTLHGRSAATQETLFTVPANVSDGTFASAVSVSASNQHLVFIDSTFDSPPQIDAVGLHTNAAHEPTAVIAGPHPITHANAGVQPMWGQAVSVHWHNQGFAVQGWLLFPPHFDPHHRY